jgi:integrase
MLSARQVQVAREGDTHDGEGLILRVQGRTASWVLRYRVASGKRRELGLGAADRGSIEAAGASLTGARELADEARDQLKRGIDPIDAKRAERKAEWDAATKKRGQAAAGATTLRSYAKAYHEKHVEPLRTLKHGQQWINSIEQHVPAALQNATLDRITALDLLDGLVPILRKVPETGSRIYQRLAAIFDAAVIDGLRPDNPATPIRRELRKRAGRRRRDNFESMPYQQAPAFARALRAAAGNSPRCLQFAILTAARTSEALTAQWAEFDWQARTWTIPAAKMKCRERHVVYLNERALEILDGQEGQSETFVFPSPRSAEVPMSNMSLLMTLRRLGVKAVTVHGFRSTFSTWANELGIAKPDAIEAALAHREQNAVRRAYNRSHFLAERRALMAAWGNFLEGRPVVRADGTPVTEAAVIQFPTGEGKRECAPAGRSAVNRGKNGGKAEEGCGGVKRGAAVRRMVPHSN